MPQVQEKLTMQMLDGSGATLLGDALASVELSVVSIVVGGVDPKIGNDARSLLRDLVGCGAGLGMPGCTSPFLLHQLSVFSALANHRVIKIACF
jgi:hypothetical protein